ILESTYARGAVVPQPADELRGSARALRPRPADVSGAAVRRPRLARRARRRRTRPRDRLRHRQGDARATADEYVAVLGTYSEQRALGQAARDELYAQMRRRIEARPGGTVRETYLGTLNVARRSPTRAGPPAAYSFERALGVDFRWHIAPRVSTAGRVRPGRPGAACSARYADSSARSSGRSSAPALVTSVGLRPRSMVSFVITHLETSRREGSSNITSRSAFSMIDRRPRAPVSRASARSAIDHSASSVKTRSMWS